MEAVKYRGLHSVALTVLVNVAVWKIVCYTLFEIAFLDFIYLEISMVIGNIILTFIKRKTGLLPPLKSITNPYKTNTEP